MDTIKLLTRKIIKFRDVRDWKQFHNPKDMAVSLTLEATEVLEHFQWKSSSEIESYIKTNKDCIGDELADVLSWVPMISHDLGINMVEAMEKKIAKNETKYPVEKAKGKHKKYTEL
jgi:dCTP diphosphatase